MTTGLKWADGFRFAKSLRQAKLLNAGKVLSSYYYSRATGQPAQWGLPFTISIEPTTSCNLRCPECPSGLRSFTREIGMLNTFLFQKIIDETQHHLLFLYLYFQGEPYLHPQFTELVRYASRKNIYTVTSTNAHFLDNENARKTVEAGLSRLIISIDGTTQESYEKYRVGGSLEKVLNGTRNLVNWKKKMKSSLPHIVLQMVVFRHNDDEVASLYRLAGKYGADEVKLKTAQIYDFENGSSLIPLNEKFSRYTITNGLYQIKNELLNHCWKMWHSCVITWDGKVVPCCFDKDARYVMGDLQKQNFRKIWFGKPYKEFRSRLLRSRKGIDICTNCSEGTKVWV